MAAFGVDQIGALDGDQVFVADGFELAQPAHRIKPHGDKAVRFDLRHVGAGGFDVEHLGFFTEAIAHARFERGIAAAMEDELRIAAEQARGVDTERQIAADARRRAIGDEVFGITIEPAAFHVKPFAPLPGVVGVAPGASRE